ncbi:methyltransferase (plasmid) [Legionella adelaidensis]|uniref:Ribosomal RNA small subunit methyltransferase D n=1 Tax=Legionella adelaidensis TaxID=45056 RepID=A0A0W0R0L4_9GAMM|nr:16S rRNA (guanine(966)-N(2))-methyltransferase RsmD [Legionella adelaidensis]KTC64507.1 methyltransferase [Legionella adelaidensis]VEH85875.1 methyltransferase [Legionella adelaidensis]
MNTVRIIGGIYKGKKLHFPSIEGLRPTPDRVKETVFNWLMHDIRDSHCLDVFAGSGNLGFEAFSRGASKVIFIEHNRKAYENIKNIIDSFHTKKLIAHHENSMQYIESCKEEFDIVFLDPPFAKDYLPSCMQLFSTLPILKIGGLVYIESQQEMTLPETWWKKLKLKKAGQVVYGLYQKIQ